MISFNQLRYLIALEDTTHFRRAAQSLGVTQPTVSAQISALERQLGVILVERKPRRSALTVIGREIAFRGRKVLRDVKDIEMLAERSHHGLLGTLRLGVPPSLGPYLLPGAIKTLHKRFPDLRLYIKEGQPAELQRELSVGSFDIVITPLPIERDELVSYILFREPLYLVTARDHKLGQHSVVDKAQLEGESILALEPGHQLHEQVKRLAEDLNINLLREYEGTSLDALRQMAAMGIGITFLPALYVASEIRKNSEVVVSRLKGDLIYRQIALVWPEGAANQQVYFEMGQILKETASKILKNRQ